MELTDREIRLVRYALGFLRSSLDRDLLVEVGQEIAPETQHTGEPLPDVPEAIETLLKRVPLTRRSATAQ
jgi:hypothetical protein